MKKLITLSLVAILATSCNAQDKKERQIEQNKSISKIVKPKGNWTVNKEVDENGNLIQYDSIYSWSSSSDNVKGIKRQQMDSVMQSFQSKFSQHFSSSMGNDFPEFFKKDSLFMEEFFSDNFFGNDFGNGIPDMKSIREKMQAMQQQFMQGQQRAIIPAIPEDDRRKGNN